MLGIWFGDWLPVQTPWFDEWPFFYKVVTVKFSPITFMIKNSSETWGMMRLYLGKTHFGACPSKVRILQQSLLK